MWRGRLILRLSNSLLGLFKLIDNQVLDLFHGVSELNFELLYLLAVKGRIVLG